ncbi:Oidioi.mRNA.OKI2018_I69.XSR.g16595.t2.cds [Oikopleura dioica]|uniref:Oidioi.mRNA.OKI2018_I69.XSR.g16595.t2.cds n=1 Tax=Oikopleura dioica TaxID=34765 RepID=A0ABN7SMY6_OIKDI|nr:Oidioi.mRNA.OKI2018_I69.XSR.g16595.t2.cds [Oikopleura dioica]
MWIIQKLTLLAAFAKSQMAEPDYSKTLFPEVLLDDCDHQEAVLKALLSTNKDCDNDIRWKNFRRLRRIPCPENQAEVDLASLNCVAELQKQVSDDTIATRNGVLTSTVTVEDMTIYCNLYLKLKCEKALP